MSKIEKINPEKIFPYLNKEFLYQCHWQSIPKDIKQEDKKNFIKEKLDPEYERIKNEMLKKKIIEPKVIYQVFDCKKQNNELIILDKKENELERFSFPVVEEFADKDSICFFAVTAGEKISLYGKKLKDQGKYVDFLYFYGIGMSLAEALAEYLHRKIEKKLKIEQGKSKRYSFGYPACPNLSDQKKLFNLIQPEKIGISLTEGYMMFPEQSVSGFINIAESS